MAKVYLVEQGYDWDPSETVGIYSTKKRANAAIKKHNRKEGRGDKLGAHWIELELDAEITGEESWSVVEEV